MSNFSFRVPCNALAFELSVILLLASNSFGQAHGPVPLPLDPLTTKEWVSAKQLVLAAHEVRQLFNPNVELRLCSVDFFVAKSSSNEQITSESTRRARVIVYDPQTDTGVGAVVNLAKLQIETVDKLDADEIPLAPADVEEARKLAIHDPIFQYHVLNEVAKDYVIEGMLMRGVDDADPCKRDRCISLLVRHGDEYVTGITTTVNLRTKKVQLSKE